MIIEIGEATGNTASYFRLINAESEISEFFSS